MPLFSALTVILVQIIKDAQNTNGLQSQTAGMEIPGHQRGMLTVWRFYRFPGGSVFFSGAD